MPTHYRGNKEDTAALNAYINLVRASETVLARAGEALAEKGLTLAQFGALEALFHLGPMCQHELSEKLLRTGGNVTYVINNLERRGLVKRERMKTDQRQIVVRLTGAGREIDGANFAGACTGDRSGVLAAQPRRTGNSAAIVPEVGPRSRRRNLSGTFSKKQSKGARQ